MGPKIILLSTLLVYWSHGAPNPTPAYGIFPLPQVYQVPGGFYYFPSFSSLREQFESSGFKTELSRSEVGQPLSRRTYTVLPANGDTVDYNIIDIQNGYDANLNEEQTFVADEDKHVLLRFTDIDLEDKDRNDVCLDYVEVTSGINSNEKYCGRIGETSPILSESNELTIKFKSDIKFNGKGFRSELWEVSKVKAGEELESVGSRKWGPEFKVSFDLMILEEAEVKKNIFAFSGDRYHNTPWISLKDLTLRFHVENPVAEDTLLEVYEHPVTLNKWIKIEITQTRKQSGDKFDYLIKVNGEEVHKAEDLDVEETEDKVTAWATNKNELAADAVYKNLVIQHDTSSRRYRNLDVKPPISGEGRRIPADTFLLQ